MFSLAPRIIAYNFFRKVGYPRILPISLTVCITHRCNSKCKTCNIWKSKIKELGVEEFENIFKSIGKNLYWVTISGGEVFLRKDFTEIFQAITDNCQPRIVSIPTNGLLYKVIPKTVEEIVEKNQRVNIVLNLSLDGVGKKHDEIRGVTDNFKKCMKTYEKLRTLEYPNFTLGIHTVVSKFNVASINEVHDYVNALKPDSYITEIAEERAELNNLGSNIAPPISEYLKVLSFISDKMNSKKYKGIQKIIQLLRLEYYNLTKKILTQEKSVIPCFAAFASAYISPEGDVWPCCMIDEPLGSLQENDYDFKKVWFSTQATDIRNKISRKSCYCTLANNAYTNMLCNPKYLTKIFLKML